MSWVLASSGRSPPFLRRHGDIVEPARARCGDGDRLVYLLYMYGVLAMDAVTFREWARLKHRTSAALIEDAMITATARTNNLIIATRNVRDFEGFDVDIFDPFARVV